jgi:NAD(P)H-dependent FMN reductase
MSDILIIGTSLDPESKSQVLARLTLNLSKEKGYTSELLDLRDFRLPLAGEAGSFDADVVLRLKEKMGTYRKFIFCLPVYNYDVSASAKNFIELVGDT